MIKKPFIRLALLMAVFAPVMGARAENLPEPIKALVAQGFEVVGRFDTPAGVQGYAAIMQQQPLAIYLTSDGKHAIVGVMINEKGTNLSQAPLDKLVSKPMTDKIWSQLEKSSWIIDGNKNAPRIVYTFTDPNCPYCHKFWNDAQPWIKTGKVQVRHIIVAILSESSAGKAAALLSAGDPKAALAQHEEQHASGGIKPLGQVSAKVRAQLDANQKLMQQLGASATPAIFYRDASDKNQMILGAPSADMLPKVLGAR